MRPCWVPRPPLRSLPCETCTLGDCPWRPSPHLAAALDDPDFGVRTSAGKALAEIGPAAVDPLLGALASGGETARVLAAEALGLMQPPTTAALAPLAAALADPVPRVADEAGR